MNLRMRLDFWRLPVSNILDYFNAVNGLVRLRHNTSNRRDQHALAKHGFIPLTALLADQNQNDGLLDL